MMRRSMMRKAVFRTPIKTALTFLLIAAASFAFFSRAADYAVTSRETVGVKSLYHGVAALDISVPPIEMADHSTHYQEDKPWPDDAELERFASLPGVTLADMRYMTAGLLDYKRMSDDVAFTECVLEGTYRGYSNIEGLTYLLFDDVSLLAGDVPIGEDGGLRDGNPGRLLEVMPNWGFYDEGYADSQLKEIGLKEGNRCLMLGMYSDVGVKSLSLYSPESEMPGVRAISVIDGLGEDYLDTEDFLYMKKTIEVVKQDRRTYDIVYTSDTRAIPRFNEHNMEIAMGRHLNGRDTDGCVVNELFLETYGLSVGDKIQVRLGDKLKNTATNGGAVAIRPEAASGFSDSIELEIVGAYRFKDQGTNRINEPAWSYTPNTIFVPKSLFGLDVPEDYVPQTGDFSVFIEDADDIAAFREKAEAMAEGWDVGLRFSDGGWLSVQDSFSRSWQVSLAAAALYAVGALLALFLAAYLFVGRNKKQYAIMRTLGVPAKEAGRAVVLPLAFLSVPAAPIGGALGIFYTSEAAKKALAGMAESAPAGYVLNTDAPLAVVAFCLAAEWAFLCGAAMLFLRRMRKTPPLELLQEGAARDVAARTEPPEGAGGPDLRTLPPTEKTASTSSEPDVRDQSESETLPPSEKTASTSSEPDTRNLPSSEKTASIPTEPPVGKGVSKRRYGAARHVCAYILRHMRRSVGKTAISLALSAVLALGIGAFVLGKLAAWDTFSSMEVRGSAKGFSAAAVAELAKSDLIKDIYYYEKQTVSVNGDGKRHNVVFTNDAGRGLDGCKVAYAEGYDGSALGGGGSLCLLGRSLAEELGVRPGDTVSLISHQKYTFLKELYEVEYQEKERFQTALSQEDKMYTVAGILEAEDEGANASVFAAAGEAAEEVVGNPFSVGTCEFSLADNEKADELNLFLDEQNKRGKPYTLGSSYYVDTSGLENIRRICALLGALFPVAVAAAALLGLLGPALVILQSAKEAALLRILGVTKRRACCMLVLEQAVLGLAGIVLVAAGLALCSPGLLVRGADTLAFCYALYFLAYACGASIAAAQATRRRLLELLQAKE